MDDLLRTALLTEEQDMPDEARAKLKLALARATLLGLDESNPGPPGQVAAGVELLQEAIKLDNNCGGKKDLDKAERLLKNSLALPANRASHATRRLGADQRPLAQL